MFRILHDASYEFIGNRKKAYVFSATLLAVCIAAGLYWTAQRGSAFRYGVDFTGGSIVRVQVPAAAEVGELRDVVGSVMDGTEITKFGGEGGEYLIRTPVTRGAATSGSDAVAQALRAKFGEDGVTLGSTEAVSAKVGEELQGRAAIAIIVSLLATLIYLAFRFEWRFGLAAIIATAHDILLTLGLISLLQLEVSLTMVAAMLTIVGYSLNDTIVIFDRIRENMKKVRRSEFVAMLNRSINETLPRTVLTGGATLATLFSLFLFGGATLREFALILIIGIVLGTYSSIYIATPVLLQIEQRWPGETAPRRKPASPARSAAARA